MKTTGTLVNYYFHCKRQCYLAGNRLNFEDNSELVKIGKALHESKLEGDKTEISIENIKIDKIQGDYLIEYKKSNSDIEASKWQLYYYLYTLKKVGIEKKGKLICYEKANQNPKTLELILTADVEAELERISESIGDLLSQDEIPMEKPTKRCGKCAYYTYCYI